MTRALHVALLLSGLPLLVLVAMGVLPMDALTLGVPWQAYAYGLVASLVVAFAMGVVAGRRNGDA